MIPPRDSVRLCAVTRRTDGCFEGVAGKARIVMVPTSRQKKGQEASEYWLYLVPLELNTKESK